MSGESFLRKNVVMVSYALVLLALVLVGLLHLQTLFLATALAYFALEKLDFSKGSRKWLSITLFLFLLFVAGYGFAYFIREMQGSMPEIVDKAIPPLVELARKYQIELSFSNYGELRSALMELAQSQAFFVSKFVSLATVEFAFVVIACVIAASIFLTAKFELDRPSGTAPSNLYSILCDQMALRAASFHASVGTVMGAQITISAINTALTMIFVFSVGMPYSVVILGVTFFCGLIPILGNLVSNTVIVCVGLSVSPKMALAALVFLVVVHKLEYFLNSRIIGGRIRNPLWLMLLGLVLGERLWGIPGMVLAPVFLHYLRTEMARFKISPVVSSVSSDVAPSATPSDKS